MDKTQFIITIISLLLGSTVISSVITVLAQKRANKSNAHKTDVEANDIERKSNLATIDYVQEELRKLYETSRKETDQLRTDNDKLQEKLSEMTESNAALHKQIDVLNHRIQVLMEWILNENAQNIKFLQDTIRSKDPDFEFPDTEPCPEIYKDAES